MINNANNQPDDIIYQSELIGYLETYKINKMEIMQDENLIRVIS